MIETPLFIVKCRRIKNQSKYQVSFPVNDTMIDRIKKLPSSERKYDNLNRCWELTTTGVYTLMQYYKKSKKLKFDFGSNEDREIFKEQVRKIKEKQKVLAKKVLELEQNKKLWKKIKAALETNYKDQIERTHKNLKKGTKLFPFQVVSAVFLERVKNALLSLEMGLGKTISAIAYVEMSQYEKVFVITPNSLKHNFYGEVDKFTESKAHIINWKKNKYTLEESKYIIVNYEFFNPSDKKKMDTKWKKLGIGKIDCVICDESHRLKNTSSNTYKNFKRLFKEGIFRDGKVSKVFLSGTPAPNRAYELYTVLNQISPIEFPTKNYFYNAYCGMTYDPRGFGGWETDFTKQHLDVLYEKITPFTYRKRKIDVLKDLPDKMYQKTILEMTPTEEITYEDIEEGVANEIFNSEASNSLTIMSRLRQYTSQLKADKIKDLIDNVLSEGDKIVIVDVFKDVLYEINKMYPDVSAVHTGDQTVEERSDIVKDFQDPNGKTKIFLGSVQTCNYGLTLTAANKLVIITLPFSVGEYDQVSDRLHRIGQKDTVNIYTLIFPDTIDEYVYDIIESKRREINKVIDNEDYKSDIKESVLGDVIKKLKRKYGREV